MGRSRGADDLSEVVRRRLETLLAEIPPRRIADGAEADGSRSIQPPVGEGAQQRSGQGGEGRPVEEQAGGGDDAAAPGRARRLARGGGVDVPSPQSARPAAVRGEASPAGTREGADADSLEPEPPADARVGWPLGRLGPQVGQFVREHLVVVGIVVLSGVLWGGYSLLQARTTPVAVAAPPSVAVSSGQASASPTPTVRLLVHVLGEVRRPGVVTLPEGARVRDALAAAGGLTSRAKPGDLNLAAPVADGSQLVIGRRGSRVSGAGSGAPGTAADPGKIDLNTASAEQLDALPGVGPVTAQKILAWRAAHGRFRAVTELQEVDGIGPKSYAELAPRVRV